MTGKPLPTLVAVFAGMGMAASAETSAAIRFAALVGDEPLICGKQYEGIGTTRSTITPRDFRFYISNVRLIDGQGKEVELVLEQDGKWQLDNVALLDFENGSGSCLNGTSDMNDSIRGQAPAGEYRGLRFTMGVPFHKNHQALASQPSPLNLTALFWAWNSGHKFARLDFSSTGQPRGVPIHLGSTGCEPVGKATVAATSCRESNRVEVELATFRMDRDTVGADLKQLLKDSNVDRKDAGCMSGPDDEDCAPLFANLGLTFGGKAAGAQTFFRAVVR